MCMLYIYVLYVYIYILCVYIYMCVLYVYDICMILKTTMMILIVMTMIRTLMIMVVIMRKESKYTIREILFFLGGGCTIILYIYTYIYPHVIV